MVQTGETEGQIVEFYEAVQRRLVGSLFAVPDALSQVLEAIRTDDVEEPQLNLIFNAMALLAREDVSVSVIAVAENGRAGDAGEIGWHWFAVCPVLRWQKICVRGYSRCVCPDRQGAFC